MCADSQPPTLSDLERICTHLGFLRQGRLQLFGEWDALVEHLRLLDLPAGSSALPAGTGVLQRRRLDDGQERVLFDARLADAPPAAGRALSLDALFEELNA